MSKNRKIKAFISCLLFAVLFGIMFSPPFAQQNLSAQEPNSEIEVLKKRILVLESKLQTVENVEKIELAAKLAEANSKLLNAEIDKDKRELKDANDEWLKSWSLWFLTIIGIFVAILIGVSAVFWFWLRSRTDQLIEDEVEKSLNGFKEAVEQLNVLKSQLGVLEKEHAASVLENFVHSYIGDELSHPEQIKALREEILLQLFDDGTRWLAIRYKAAEVLVARKSTRFISPALKFLNSVINSDLDSDPHRDPIDATERYLTQLIRFVGGTYTEEAYQGLTKFLNRLLTEYPKYKDLFLTWTVFSLTRVSVGLHKGDLISILRRTVTDLKVFHYQDDDLKILAEHFGRFNEPEGIKEILINGLTDEMPDVETKCLELLQKHDPDFVKEWKAQKEAATTETEESS